MAHASPGVAISRPRPATTEQTGSTRCAREAARSSGPARELPVRGWPGIRRPRANVTPRLAMRTAR